jgi:flagellin
MTMLSINTNVGALKASQASYSVNKSMETSMQRLSSGLRVNSAADDAAGVQIANRLTAEIQGLNQSVRNASDAQAMLATAEGASQEVHLILLRMRELAVQAANGTADGGGDRAALKSEFDALETEINRIAAKTTFAGIQLVDGSFTGADSGRFQVGARGSETITHTIESLNSVSIAIPAAIDLTTYTKATSAITALDKAISNVGTEREQLGAVMNRLDHTIANLQNIATNLSAAKGRIIDADFAAETSNLARTQVLQQASMAMLSQANASKQNILSLFQ